MRYKKLISIIMAAAIILSTTAYGIPTLNAEEKNLPDFSIRKSIDKTTFAEGDTGKLTYTIVPEGRAPESFSASADIVLVMDVSTSMADGNKIEKAADAAGDFFNRMKGTGHKAAFVAFGYKTGYASELTTDYDSLIDEVNEYNRHSNLMDGTNHDDGLKKAMEILTKSSSKNKYVVFMTDGMPNYFTTTENISKYNNNWYKETEGNIKYYTNWPKNTPEAYSYAVNDSIELSKSGITMFTVGVGKGYQVDLKFLDEISKAGSGKLFKAIEPDAMSKIFEQISTEIDNVSISNIKIKEKLPQGVSLGSNDNAYIDDDGYVVINVAPITYKKGAAKSPEPFAVDLNIELNKSGKYTLNDSIVQFKDWKGQDGSKNIGNVDIEVSAAPGEPALTVSKAMANNSATVGENITLQYSIIPTGVYKGANQETDNSPVDMVILFDKSSNMKYNYGGGNNRKDVLEKETAIGLVNTIKAMNNNSRIGYIEYNRYAKSVKSLTEDYQAVIDSINKTNADTIPAHESGVNYEAALTSAKKMLEGSTNNKMIILLTGSKPDYYIDAYSKHLDYSYYKKNDKDFQAYLDASRYWFLGYHYSWDSAYNNYYANKLNGKYDITKGDYAYTAAAELPYSEAQNVVNGLADTTLNVMAIGKYHENSSKNDDDYDLEYLRNISASADGSTYEYIDKEKLYNAVKNPKGSSNEGSSQYNFKNLVITENFPENVEILTGDNITIGSDGRSFTANIPDITYTKDMGTPSRVVLEVKVNFKSEGEYVLSGLSKLDYTDNDNTAKMLEFNKLNISVSSPNYRIDKVTAEKTYTAETLTGIKVDWNGNSLSNTGEIKGFEVMRSINGFEFEKIAESQKSIFEYIDTAISATGRYVYRIDTILTSGERVEGILSNEVLLLGGGTTNVNKDEKFTWQKMQINGKDVSQVFETYKLNCVISLEVLSTGGITGAGIKDSEFLVRLNDNVNSDILYKIKDNIKLVKVVNGENEAVTGNLTYQIISNESAEASIKIAYDGILAPGYYKVIFDTIPEKKIGAKLPEEGTVIKMLVDMSWVDVGIEGVTQSKQLQYTIKILPLPKLQ